MLKHISILTTSGGRVKEGVGEEGKEGGRGGDRKGRREGGERVYWWLFSKRSRSGYTNKPARTDPTVHPLLAMH